MTALEALVPEAGLHVVATTDLVGPLPVRGDDVVVLCLEDEFAVPPRYAHDVRLVAKTTLALAADGGGAGGRRPDAPGAVGAAGHHHRRTPGSPRGRARPAARR